VLALSLTTLALFGPRATAAQSNCPSPATGALTSTAGFEWTDVLARTVSLHGRDIPLREALDRLAAAARIRLSYTAELLPLTRSVCLSYEAATVGRVLTELLAGTTLRPVGAGSDQVVLAPSPAPAESPATPTMVAMFRQVGVLDRVFVTGSAAGASQRSLPIALDVLTGQQLSHRSDGSLSSALDGNVPGLWLWEQSPLSLLARYGSIRGASSFGVSYPKVYVDGIEVANSLLVTRLDPEAVSRVEVIRGPQGAALYGADAISGVINIVTRQDGTEGGAPRAQVNTSGGASASAFSVGNVLAQNHSLSLRAGSGNRSARLGVTVSSIGAFIPDAFSRGLTANGGVRFVGAKSVVTGTFRFFGEDARTPSSPLLAGLTPVTPAAIESLRRERRAALMQKTGRHYSMLAQPDDSTALPPTDSLDRQSVRQYTLGTMATFRPGDRWTHSAVAGVDGYSLKSGGVLDGAFPSSADSALRAARGSAIRGTLRASSVGQFGDSERTSATVTLAAEYSLIRDRTDTDAPFALYRPGDNNGGSQPGPGGPTNPVAAVTVAASSVNTRSNTGLIAQANASYHDALFLSSGLRLERNTGVVGVSEYETLPMLGAAFVRSLGFGTLKLRSAYGKGIRPPQTSSRYGTLMGLNRSPTSYPLSAETQSGIEAGADMFIGRAITVHVTRFDQLASGLIQPVSVALPNTGDASMHQRRIAYELQNVGEISNRGWELEGILSSGPYSLGGTFSTVDSRVQKLAPGYTGDLRRGDRMLEVPARTLGLNASYSEKKWWTTWSVSRASDWVNYDRIALAAAFMNANHPIGEFLGPQLRYYWRDYEGVTRLGANFGYNLSHEWSFTVRGENLLDKQEGEPDNVTVLPGRTVTAGLRLSF
jgi:iron complex outermembrane recepter protein